MKSIYFYYSKPMKSWLALGQILALMQACYFRGRELGFENVIFVWKDGVSYPGWTKENTCKGNIFCPGNNIFPMKVVSPEFVLREDVYKIDLSEPNSLYEGCPIVIKPDGYRMAPTYEFLNNYYKNHNERPVFSIHKNTNEKYILFHYRESTQERQIPRNTPYDDWKKLFMVLKEKYGKEYKFKKIGEPSKLDGEFDEVFDYFPNNIEELFKIVNNAILYVGNASGPSTLGFMFEIPAIILLNELSKPSYVGKDSIAHKWVDDSKYLCLWKGEYDIIQDKEKICDFVDRLKI